MLSTDGYTGNCMRVVRLPAATPAPIQVSRTSLPIRSSVISSVLPGRVFIDADYSQLELRVFAALSGDVKMIASFEDGWDYHDLIVQRVGCTRRQAKAINFGIIFGMGVATLAADLGVDEVTAGEYLRGWDEQAPTGAVWRSERPRLYAAEQGVRTARRWIDYLDDDDADA
jgi:DNA polymerase I-like protein with 3'-5' exonuclease and polymerase domains